MELNAFVTRCLRHTTAYLEAVEAAAGEGRLTNEQGVPVKPSFPSMLLICQTETHFAAELLGSSPDLPQPLQLVKKSLPSPTNLLGQMEAGGASSIDVAPGVGGVALSRLALLGKRDVDLFTRRYPEAAELYRTALIFDGTLASDDAFNALRFSPESLDIWLNDVLTMNTWRGQVRARYFQSFWMIERKCSSSELQRRLNRHHPIGGPEVTLTMRSDRPTLTTVRRAANFASLAAVDKIGETTLTKFLELNEDILKVTLGAERLIGQPLRPWREGNSDPHEVAIQPDFLFVDRAGEVHICEVKLPLLKRTSLTKGRHKRREFISPVSEGISQLGNYADYFSRASHRQLIEERFKVTVADPRMVLIVGSAENYDHQQALEASRMLKAFELLDYDSVRALYLAQSGYTPGVEVSSGLAGLSSRVPAHGDHA